MNPLVPFGQKKLDETETNLLFLFLFLRAQRSEDDGRGQKESTKSGQRDPEQVLGVPELLREELLRYVTAKLLAPVEETAKARPTDKKDKLKFDSASSFIKGCIFMEICFVFRVNPAVELFLSSFKFSLARNILGSLLIFSRCGISKRRPSLISQGNRTLYVIKKKTWDTDQAWQLRTRMLYDFPFSELFCAISSSRFGEIILLPSRIILPLSRCAGYSSARVATTRSVSLPSWPASNVYTCTKKIHSFRSPSPSILLSVDDSFFFALLHQRPHRYCTIVPMAVISAFLVSFKTHRSSRFILVQAR